MKTTANDNSVVLPQTLWAEVEAAAVDERRSVDDVVRDLIEHGLNERRWRLHAAQEHWRARPKRSKTSLTSRRIICPEAARGSRAT
jgi:Arc/MetJ-type ribon-helix-helix transcriptional regulator